MDTVTLVWLLGLAATIGFSIGAIVGFRDGWASGWDQRQRLDLDLTWDEVRNYDDAR